MPVFSQGGMRFQQSWRDTGQPIEPKAQELLAATVRRGIELGVTHIETARGYGTSERQLGMLLPELDRDRIILQTKVSPEPDSEQFTANVLDSLDRLGQQRVDLLSIHGINTYEKLWWATRPGGCLARARILQEEGRVGHVGFSTHGCVDLIRSAVEHQADGGFDYVNLHWYYIWQDNWPAVTAAAQRDMGVFIISPNDKGGRLYDPSPELVELCRPLHPMVFNALFCLARPEVHTLSIGASSPTDFDVPLESLGLVPDADTVLPDIEERLAAAMEEALGRGVAHRLFEGVPTWESAPGYVNVRVIIWLRSLVLAFGMREYAKSRYNLLGSGGDWFPGLNAARAPSLDWGRALRGSPNADEIPGWLEQAHDMLAGEGVNRISQS